MTAIDSLGWVATGVFVSSYFFASPALVRQVQMAGALVWVVYGVALDAVPVIVANVLVLAAAAWASARQARRAS